MRRPVSRAASYRAALLSESAARERLNELRSRPMLWDDESAEAVLLARRLGEPLAVWRLDFHTEQWTRIEGTP